MLRQLPGLLSHAALALAVVLAVGCSSFPSFRYNRPPTVAVAERPAISHDASRSAIVIGSFENPVNAPLQWKDIGPGMSEALAGTMLNHGAVDVWIDAPLARSIEKAIGYSPARRKARIERLREENPTVRYVVIGRVTDFAHTDDVAPEVRRWGMFGRKREAVVAIYLNVIDLENGRVVVTDHIHGVSPTPDKPAGELYANMNFGTYLFWNTPLGKASERAITRASNVVHRVLPGEEDALLIARQLGPRELQLVTEVENAHERGRLHYVCLIDPITGRHTPVLDADSDRPLTARTDASGRAARTAWLLGRPPIDVELRGAALCPAPPAARPRLAEGAEVRAK